MILHVHCVRVRCSKVIVSKMTVQFHSGHIICIELFMFPKREQMQWKLPRLKPTIDDRDLETTTYIILRICFRHGVVSPLRLDTAHKLTQAQPSILNLILILNQGRTDQIIYLCLNVHTNTLTYTDTIDKFV